MPDITDSVKFLVFVQQDPLICETDHVRKMLVTLFESGCSLNETIVIDVTDSIEMLFWLCNQCETAFVPLPQLFCGEKRIGTISDVERLSKNGHLSKTQTKHCVPLVFPGKQPPNNVSQRYIELGVIYNWMPAERYLRSIGFTLQYASPKQKTREPSAAVIQPRFAESERNLSELFLAVRDGNVQSVIELCPKVNVNSSEPSTNAVPLSIAVNKNNHAIVKILLENGADPNKQPVVALAAAIPNAVDILTSLFQFNAKADIPDTNGRLPLAISASRGFTENVKIILECVPATLTGTDFKKKLAIHHVASTSYVLIAQMMLNINSVLAFYGDSDGNTALHIAVESGQFEIASLIAGVGKQAQLASQTQQAPLVDIRNRAGITALHIATMNGNTEMMEMIIQNGASVNVTNNHGETALHLAAKNENVSAVKMLCGLGIDVNAVDSNQRTALHYAVIERHFENVEALILLGANVNACDEKGFTPLAIAAQEGIVDIASSLIVSGKASVDIANALGQTPLLLAVIAKNVAMVKLLIANFANASIADTNTVTPLHAAAREGTPELVLLLIEANSPLDAKDMRGMTPLAHAVQAGNKQIVKLLIIRGASPFLRGDDSLKFLCINPVKDIIELMTSAIIPRWTNCPQTVSFAAMQLSYIPTALCSLRCETLDLTENRLDYLPPTFANASFKDVLLKGNPLSTFPKGCSNWTKQVKPFLLQLIQRSSPFKHFRVVFLGNENCGKTSLIKALKSKKSRDKDIGGKKKIVANGIEIYEDFLSSHDSNCSFTAWDCNGLPMFSPMVLLALQSEAVFVIVYDGSDKRAANQVEYWANLISCTRSPNLPPAQVIIVGTHLDIQSLFSSLRPSTLANINIVSSLNVSSKDNRNINTVRLCLTETIPNATLNLRNVQPSFLLFRDNLKRYTEPFYDKQAFATMATKTFGLLNSEVKELLRFLSNTGDIVSVDENQRLISSVVITNVPLFFSVASAFLSYRMAKPVVNNIGGAVPSDLLSEILSNMTVNNTLAPMACKVLLEKFEIMKTIHVNSREVFLSGYFLTPTSLKVNTLWQVIPEPNVYEQTRILRLPFLPVCLFHRLVVRLLAISGSALVAYWGSGIILKCGKETALVTAMRTDDPFPVGQLNPQAKKNTEITVCVRRFHTPTWIHQSVRYAEPIVLLEKVLSDIDSLLTVYYPLLASQITQFVQCPRCMIEFYERFRAEPPSEGSKILEKFEPHLLTFEECKQMAEKRITLLSCMESASLFPDIRTDFLLPEVHVELPLTPHVLADTKLLQTDVFGNYYTATYNKSAVTVLCPTVSNEVKSVFNVAALTSFSFLCPSIANVISVVSSPKLSIIYEGVGNAPLLSDYLSTQTNGLSDALLFRFALELSTCLAYLHSLIPSVFHHSLRSRCVRVLNVDPNSNTPTLKVFESDISRLFTTSSRDESALWRWQAPELFSGQNKAMHGPADMYSFGIVLWELACAPNELYRQESASFLNTKAMIAAVFKGTCRPQIPPERLLPADFVSLYNSLVANDPNARPTADRCKTFFALLLAQTPLIPTAEMTSQLISYRTTQYEQDLQLKELQENAQAVPQVGVVLSASAVASAPVPVSVGSVSALSSSVPKTPQASHSRPLPKAQPSKSASVPQTLKLLTTENAGTTVTACAVIKEKIWQGTIAGWIVLRELTGVEVARLSLLPPGVCDTIVDIVGLNDSVWIGFKSGAIFAVSAFSRDILFHGECPGGVTCLSAFGTQVWAGTYSGFVIAWNATTFQELLKVSIAQIPISGVYCIEGIILIAVDKQIMPYDGTKMTVLAAWPILPEPLAIIKGTRSSTGIVIYTACTDGTLGVWGPFITQQLGTQPPTPAFISNIVQPNAPAVHIAITSVNDVWLSVGNMLLVSNNQIICEERFPSQVTAMVDVPNTNQVWISFADNSMLLFSR